jgi:hypothetical protein
MSDARPKGGRRNAGAIAASIAVLGVLGSVVVNYATSDDASWLSPMGIAVVIVGVSLAILAVLQVRAGAADAPRSLGDAADALAVAVRARSDAEAILRRVNDRQLPISWHGERGAAAGSTELDGSGNGLVDLLDRVPARRLLVLGDSGSGKTVLLMRLALDLLARRTAGSPVPVLMSLASWSPQREGLHSWLVGRLVAEHRWLGSAAPSDERLSLARALLTERLVLPILDGLDEMPDSCQPEAIDQINAALGPGDAVVVSCRSAEYRTASARSADLNAAVIKLRKLDNDVVERFLRAGAGAGAERWDPVVAALSAGGPVGRALRTPLLVGLANTVYNPRPDSSTGTLPDPATLCDPGRFPHSSAVRNHLLGAWVQAAYRSRPDPEHRSRWSAPQAERYLTFLAHHLQHDLAGERDLAWWRIRLHLGDRFRWLLWGDNFGPSSGMRVNPGSILIGMVACAIPSLFLVAIFGLGALWWGVLMGVAASVWRAGAQAASLTDPAVTLARDRRTFVKIWIFSGVFGGGAFGALFWQVVGSYMPQRAIAILCALALTAFIGLGGGMMTAVQRTAWGPFLYARYYLASRRRLPWQLMDFLADANQNRGVLRRVGAVYQFRHIELQRHLSRRWDEGRTQGAAVDAQSP